MMKSFIILLLLVMTTLLSFGEKIATFSDIYAPVQVRVDDNKLYISEKASVFIYSLDNFKLIKKFGGEGEGPREFKRYAFLYPLPEYLLVNSVGKISYYKKDGMFIKEVKAKGDVANFAPLGKYFVARSFRIARDKKEKINYKTLNLYDSNLTKVHEIFKQELDWQQGKGTKLFHLAFSYQVHDNRIYIAGHKDFFIDVFDTEGKLLFTISQKYEKVKFSKDHKKKMLAYIKRTRPERYQYWEQSGLFPDYFPAVNRILIRDQLLYVMTFKKQDNRYELFIFNLEGKRLKKIFVPLKDLRFMMPYPFEIDKNKLYQTVESDKTEVIELHRFDIPHKGK